MSWNPIWEDIFSSQEWGKYSGESLIKFVARNFYKQNRSDIKILELGCGPGANLGFVQEKDSKFMGLMVPNKQLRNVLKG